MSDNVKIGVIKLGCLGIAALLDAIFDERADREDLDIRGFTSGAKLDPDSCEDTVKRAIEYKPNLMLVVSPNAKLPGPTKAREMLFETKIPTISISDAPGKKAFKKKNEEGKKVDNVLEGQGYIVIPADSMIGARREFLDPTEMITFNTDVMKVLSNTGYVRVVQKTVGKVIDAIKAGKTPEMPMSSVSAKKAVEKGGFSNPYARAKAFAAITIAESVADITTEGCFIEQDKDKYIPLVAAGHELMRVAARLSDEAREIEKGSDTVLRTPHSKKGERKKKRQLLGDFE
ncbi:MAG: F420-dependent methylenetetrahydromethanopterin dehydrogenase [Candidatus Thorarchaeota archaeon]|nr:MAG: F420-dependent methylenetetrahydromethanopterin dehydrogenase [Candidatus Thorarchaeota archaeon]